LLANLLENEAAEVACSVNSGGSVLNIQMRRAVVKVIYFRYYLRLVRVSSDSAPQTKVIITKGVHAQHWAVCVKLIPHWKRESP
jgi:hypothetical protein